MTVAFIVVAVLLVAQMFLTHAWMRLSDKWRDLHNEVAKQRNDCLELIKTWQTISSGYESAFRSAHENNVKYRELLSTLFPEPKDGKERIVS